MFICDPTLRGFLLHKCWKIPFTRKNSFGTLITIIMGLAVLQLLVMLVLLFALDSRDALGHPWGRFLGDSGCGSNVSFFRL